MDAPRVVAHEESGQQIADVIAGHDETTDRAGEVEIPLQGCDLEIVKQNRNKYNILNGKAHL